MSEASSTSAFGANDVHDHFRDLCVIYGDFHRAVFLEQILHFVAFARKQELDEIRKVVQERAKGLRAGGKRGRPSAQDDEELSYQARRVAWQHHVEGMTWRQIAEAAGIRVTSQNIKQVTRTLQRREDYLAAKISHAVPPSYVVQDGEKQGDLKPGILDHKPLQQILWSRVALPFRTHPDECKKIVRALWPRASEAAFRELDLRFANTQRRNRRS